MFGFHISKAKKTLLDHTSACDSLPKHNEKNAPFLKQIVTGDESGYCTIMWNGRDCGASEMNYHKPHQSWSSSKEGDVGYMVGLKGSPLL